MDVPRRIAIAAMALICAAMLCACQADKLSGYNKAIDAFADGDYEEAASAFVKLGDYQQAETYAAYSTGLTLYEQGRYDEAEPYFEKSRGFMYGEQRYAYCHAYTLEISGAYAEAAEGFAALETFEDSPTHKCYCEGRAAEADKRYEDALYAFETAGDYSDAAVRLENLQTQVYNRAVLLRSQGSYEQALNLFGKLGEYFDSPVQARECKQFFREQRYAEAEALLNAGDEQGAYEMFSGLEGFSDAAERSEQLAAKLGIDVGEAEQ